MHEKKELEEEKNEGRQRREATKKIWGMNYKRREYNDFYSPLSFEQGPSSKHLAIASLA